MSTVFTAHHPGLPLTNVRRLLLVAIAMGFAVLIQLGADQHDQSAHFSLGSFAFSNSDFYGEETSATMPGPYGATRRIYKWSKPSSSLTLWPALPTGSVLTIEYLNSSGAVRIKDRNRFATTVPASEKLRVLHIMLPPNSNTPVEMIQTVPKVVDQRLLGFAITSVRWMPISATQGLVWGPLVVGLPLTVALVIALLATLPLLHDLYLLLPLGLLGGSALLLPVHPWYIRGMQPLLQSMVLAAIAGVVIFKFYRHHRTYPWIRVLVAVWTLSLLLFTPVVRSDGIGYYAYVRSAFIDHDLQLADEFDPHKSPFGGLDSLVTDLPPSAYAQDPWSVGPALAWTPFWLLGHAIVLLGRQLHVGWAPDGYAPPYVVLSLFGSSVAGLATIIGCFCVVKHWFSPTIAGVTAIALYLGSNLLYYAQFEGSFAHSISAATVTWFIVALLFIEQHSKLRHWLALGLAIGAMVVTYWISAILLIIPLCVVVREVVCLAKGQQYQGIGKLIVFGSAALAVSLVVFFPQMATWRVLYGSWITIPQGQSFVAPEHNHLLDVMIGPLYGLAWWTPAFFLGLIGSVFFALRRPWPGLILLLAIGVYTLYNAFLPDWHGSGAFGFRRLTVLTPFFALGLATIFDRLRRFPFFLSMLISNIIIWSLEIHIRFVTYQIPHEPYELLHLRLSDIILHTTPFPLTTFFTLIQHSWLGRLLGHPGLGGLLILLGGLIIGIPLVSLLSIVGMRLKFPQHWQTITPGGEVPARVEGPPAAA